MSSSSQFQHQRPLKPTLDNHLWTLNSTLASLYRIAMTLSPGIFLSFFARFDEGVNDQERRERQFDFWRSEAERFWDDILTIDASARTSDVAMMMAIGQLMANSPDHPLHSAFERWVGEHLPELEYDVSASTAHWQEALQTELRALPEHCESLRWLHEQDRDHFVVKRFVDCRHACKYVVDLIDRFLTLGGGTRAQIAIDIMPSLREVSDAFHQTWCYDIQGEPELTRGLDAQIDAALKAIKTSADSTTDPNLVWSAETMAEKLGVSISHIWALNASGRIPRPRKLGTCSRWCAKEVAEWVELGCPSRERWEKMRQGDAARK